MWKIGLSEFLRSQFFHFTQNFNFSEISDENPCRLCHCCCLWYARQIANYDCDLVMILKFCRVHAAKLLKHLDSIHLAGNIRRGMKIQFVKSANEIRRQSRQQPFFHEGKPYHFPSDTIEELFNMHNNQTIFLKQTNTWKLPVIIFINANKLLTMLCWCCHICLINECQSPFKLA